MITATLSDRTQGIRRAARILRDGGLVGFPTETVYGLGTDARQSAAVKRVFQVKKRPETNPLIVHVGCIADAAELVEFSQLSIELANRFWPGPLTLVLPMLPSALVCEEAAGGHRTLAVRVPAHPVARQLIELANCPIAAPSANISGRISPTTAEHVLSDLSGAIEAVVDGGPCPRGMESTILAPVGSGIVMLRPGAITREAILELAPVRDRQAESDALASPGQLARHYSPTAPMRLNARSVGEDELLLGFGPTAAQAPRNLSPTGELEEAAFNLYGMLRQLDILASRSGSQRIAVSPIPERGVGVAINDRLRRAAHRTENAS